MPARSVKQFIVLARARPGDPVHATQGEASTGRITAELCNEQINARFLHVPYKGGGPAMIDLIDGQVSPMFATISTALLQVKVGRIVALGVTSKQRSSAFPDAPTIAEAGVPGYEAIIFDLMVAPAGTPLDMRMRLQGDQLSCTAQAVHRTGRRAHGKRVARRMLDLRRGRARETQPALEVARPEPRADSRTRVRRTVTPDWAPAVRRSRRADSPRCIRPWRRASRESRSTDAATAPRCRGRTGAAAPAARRHRRPGPLRE